MTITEKEIEILDAALNETFRAGGLSILDSLIESVEQTIDPGTILNKDTLIAFLSGARDIVSDTKFETSEAMEPDDLLTSLDD